MNQILEEDQLIQIIGGISLSGAIVNAFLSVGKFIYEVGQKLGSSFRRIGSNQLCPLQ